MPTDSSKQIRSSSSVSWGSFSLEFIVDLILYPERMQEDPVKNPEKYLVVPVKVQAMSQIEINKL